jgi:hypothetical protein
MIPRSLPDYVEQGGRQVYRPPYVARKATLTCFVVKGHLDSLNNLLDRDLNEPSDGEVHYRCATDRIFFVFADIGELTSVDKPDADFGYVAEKELSIWLLAADLTLAAPTTTHANLVWYLPYVFTDSGQAIATGREVYGYPKQQAEMHIDASQLSASAMAIASYGAGKAATMQPVVTAHSDGGSLTRPSVAAARDLFSRRDPQEIGIDAGLRPGGSARPSAEITIAGGLARPPGGAGGVTRSSLGKVLLAGFDMNNTLDQMIQDPRLVFLKQFRDVECPTKACYQAIVEAPIVVQQVREAEEIDAGVCTVDIYQYDTHPLASELLHENVLPGRSTTKHCVLAFTAKVEFEIALGEEIWRAT